MLLNKNTTANNNRASEAASSAEGLNLSLDMMFLFVLRSLCSMDSFYFGKRDSFKPRLVHHATHGAGEVVEIR